ncbi:MAG: DUF2304 domain-containing protein [Acidimicrobiia bacterium]|nr:DUF2304 domain-containing protein [Acidimicrobiia bacterium]
MERLLNVTSLLSIALIVSVLMSLRRAHIRVEYSVSWLAAGVLVLVLSRWEQALEVIAGWIGIRYPPAALLSMTIAIFLVVLYRMSMILSALKDNNIALAQRLAIVEFHLESVKGNGEKAAQN